jgi:hypothetical protein
MSRQQTKNIQLVWKMAAAIRRKFRNVIKYDVYCISPTYEMSVNANIVKFLCIKQNMVTTAFIIRPNLYTNMLPRVRENNGTGIAQSV